MTDMRRITVSFPEDIGEQLEALKKTDRFAGRPYSELIRYLVTLVIQSNSRKARANYLL